jgi:tetratricopeptide (TPR) repeat protein
MIPGERIGERFEIEREAGAGGMGTVYRARDLSTGERVALKLMHGLGGFDAERFAREAEVLAALRHPGVVRFVAYGTTGEGVSYLAMEWVEGEDLRARLERAELTVAESVALGQKIAAALAAVHALGVVHRDLKPENLRLSGGRVDQVKVLDFGVVRQSRGARATRTGAMIGTPGYMAPEQVRGARDVDARADVFALGCVLFECLTGRPAFAGEQLVAVLAKVLLEEAPRVSELKQGLPAALDALVARMLAKDPAGRPADGAAALAELEAVGPLGLGGGPGATTGQARPLATGAEPAAARLSSGLTAGEQRLVSVLLVGAAPTSPAEERGVEAPTMKAEAGPLALTVGEHGGRLEQLAGGALMVTLTAAGAATDLATRAARCALAVRRALPDRPMALATGRARVGGGSPVGEVIDRAAKLVAGGEVAGGAIPIDGVTAGLLGARFELSSDRGVRGLQAERERVDEARTLLGKPTPCVGRERELLTLTAVFDECVAEPAARVALVTAAAGVGKSRLRDELVGRVRARGDEVEVWSSQGDPMRAGAPLGLLGQVVAGTARLLDGEPIEARRQKLAARVARHVAEPIRARVTEFLGELVGTPFPDEGSVQLRAARKDARLMSDQVRRAFVDFAEAECRRRPVLLVLEDLHWGDLPTIECTDMALRVLRDRPLMVLALARPEVHELFPRLWAQRERSEIRLGELSRKACEKLAREVLGEEATTETIARLWERSAGNAFFLEELLRAEVEGRHDDVPGTVLAMVQSRLEALPPGTRRILRAGSLLGEVFWLGAVAALLDVDEDTLDAELAELERQELVARRPEARFQRETELVFRHALIREVAYGMLTDEDRVLGHRLSGDWLERAGEKDAGVVAEHFERGASPERAVERYLRAAEQALEGNDLVAAIGRVDRAIACGATGEVLGALSLVRAEAHRWLADIPEAEWWALAAMRALPEGSQRWYLAAADAALAARSLGRRDRVLELAEKIERCWSAAGATRDAVVAMARTASELAYAGEYVRAEALHVEIVAEAARFGDEPLTMAHVCNALSWRAVIAGNVDLERSFTEAAVSFFELAGDVRQASGHRANLGSVCNQLGDYEESVRILRVVVVEGERMGLRALVAVAKNNLGLALARLGSLDEAELVETEAAETHAAVGDRRMEGSSRTYLAIILRLRGELERGEAEARRALLALEHFPPLQPLALAELAMLLLARGQNDEARAAARRAVEITDELQCSEEGAGAVRLALAEALEACGDHDAARAAVEEARAALLVRADKISEPSSRARFLERVPEHARTIELSRAWSSARGAG